jgi:NTP pyrophosphatase (non-canonical NTP hydrolase)
MEVKEFSTKNWQRHLEHYTTYCKDWGTLDWWQRTNLEMIELRHALLIHKFESTAENLEEVGKEIADVATYLDLICSHLGLSFEAILRAKFNEVSDRVGSDIKL